MFTGVVEKLGYADATRFIMLLDKGSSVTDAYGVQALPHTVIVDQDGEIDSIPLGSEDVLDSVRRLLNE